VNEREEKRRDITERQKEVLRVQRDRRERKREK